MNSHHVRFPFSKVCLISLKHEVEGQVVSCNLFNFNITRASKRHQKMQDWQSFHNHHHLLPPKLLPKEVLKNDLNKNNTMILGGHITFKFQTHSILSWVVGSPQSLKS